MPVSQPFAPGPLPGLVDVLVFGSGAAGLTAALVAALRGAEVLVCEKTPQFGGTTATSGGTIWAPGAPPIRRAGGMATVEQARRYLAHELGEHYDASRVDAFLATAAEAVEYLERHSDVRFEHTRNPDYHVESPGGSATGHAMTAMPFDGRLLGESFALLRPPRDVFMVAGGMMVGRREIPLLLAPWRSLQAARHTVRRLWRHARSRLRHPRGTDLMIGNALVARLLASLSRSPGVRMASGARLLELTETGGRVDGAVVEHDGARIRIQARRGVVLATGGFPHSAPLRDRLAAAFPHQRSMACEGATGDGIAAGLQVGARIDSSIDNPAFWSPASVRRHRGGTETLWVHGHLDRGKPGLLAVDQHGRRFVNEADSYHDFVVAMFRGRDGMPATRVHLIADDDFVRRYGLGLARPGWSRRQPLIADGYLIREPSIERLAIRLEVDRDTLARTIATYDRDADTGVDSEFGRGSRELNRFNGDAANRPNPCMRRLQPPYCAVRVEPCSIGTTIGLATDADGRVLRAGENRPIDGLFACGNDMASVMGGWYPGPGVTLGPAIVFAYRAARALTAAGTDPTSTLEQTC
ncbi:MAG: FAD-dependent oxidoreductase [Lautropia sp.]